MSARPLLVLLAFLTIHFGWHQTLPAADSPVVISEFMASNAKTLADEDGDHPDWIELRNLTASTVNLEGWFLTDTTNHPAKWRLPSTHIVGNGYLVVFASGKNRSVPGAPLHTSFQLSAKGAYLALVLPDGVTIASDFAPAYPEQFTDVSYGPGIRATTLNLIATGASARFLVPLDGSLGASWTSRSFDDAAWESGPTGIGFATNAALSANGLYAYWPVQEGVGDIASNLVDGGAQGVLHGATWVTDDPQRGTVLSFNGQDSYVEAGGIPFMGQSTSNFTWSFWYKQRSIPNGNAVVLGNRSGGGPGPLQFIKFTPSHFEYYRGGDIGFMAFGIPTGDWQHLAVVKQGPTLTYYRNGSPIGTAEAQGDIDVNPFYWGGDPGASGECADGLLDDISLWTSALTAEQVRQLVAGVSPAGLGGIGPSIATDIRSRMQGVNASAYLRIPFTVADGPTPQSLALRMKYQDGFIAYLNGVEVARRNAPAEPRWDSTATAEHPPAAAAVFEDIDISAHMEALETGANVLAIQGLNLEANNPDFLILPELRAVTVTDLGDRYFTHPTPGAANDAGVLGVVADTKFDPDRGFYDSPFEVTIACSTPGVTIQYTTNGTEPSPTNGWVYSGPIPIRGTTTLRAGAFMPDYETRKTETQTYLFLDQVLAQNGAGLPQDWGRDWQLDPRVVTNAAYAGEFREDMKSLPIVSVVMDPEDFWGPNGIYTQATSRGANYERPGSAELFFPDGSRKGFQINCGIRIIGSASRSGLTPKHGVGLVFKSEYGPSKLKFPFFDDSPVDSFDILYFRPNFNMSWVRTDNSGPLNNGNADGAERTHAIYVRDQFTKESQLAMGQVSAHERFVHLYINGVYWGLFNPSERTDASFAAAYLGGNKEDYDAIFSDPSTVARAVDGDKTAWNTMMTLANQGLSSAAAYAQIQQYLEVTNLADYMMLNFYCATVDWPWQNWNAARRREPGAQFRFFAWDAEYTLETPPWVPDDRTGVGNDPSEADSPARLYQKLRQNPEWRLLFADRAQKHFFNEGALTTHAATARFLKLCDEIQGGIVGESARWGDVVRKNEPYTRDKEWLTEKNRLLTQFFPQRTDRVLAQLKKIGLFPDVPAPTFNSRGGVFTQALRLILSAPSGIIYYTLDGTDPRLPGGMVSSNALVYIEPINVSQPLRILARTLSDGQWSALDEGVYSRQEPAPALTALLANGQIILSWPAAAGDFTLQSAISLADPQWTAVPGVKNRQIIIPLTAPSQFYRLAKP